MDTLLEIWGLHLNEQAMRLLQRASMVAETQHINVNILHVLFVALTDASLHIYHQFTATFQREELLTGDVLVQDERVRGLIHEVQTQMARDALHFSLDMCKLACMETALEQRVQISDILIVAQIIDKSYRVRRILQRERLLSALSNTLHSREKSSTPPTRRTPSGPLNAREVGEVLEKVNVVASVREDAADSFLTRLNEALHQSTFEYLQETLTRMVSESRRKILLLCGRNGSVFDQKELGNILAYRLATSQGEMRASGQAQPVLLEGYRFWQMSVHTLRAMYTANPRFHPVLALKHLKQEARQQRAILVLTELETVSTRSSVDRGIKEQLTHLDNTCLVGCYTYYDRRPDEQELRLGLSHNDITIVYPDPDPQPSRLPEIHEWIEDYYRRQRPERPMSLAPAALERLFHLEQGIWIYKQRKAFPALAIEVLDGCLSMYNQGPSHVREQAQGALSALQDLLHSESQETPEGIRKQFQEILLQACAHMEQLIDDPGPEIRTNNIVITQPLVEAQVFNSSSCEFHFPGHFPWATPQQP